MAPRHYGILLALGTFCHAWQAQFSQATQCEDVTVKWSGTGGEKLGPPFVVRLAAFGLAPLQYEIPTSAWNDSAQAGSYRFFMPWPGNTEFVASMDDGFGSGTGGVTGIQTVKASSNSSCVTSTITQPEHVFDLYGTFEQCSVLSMNWTEPATSNTLITGLVPNGIAFQLDVRIEIYSNGSCSNPPLVNARSTSWNLNIPAGTAFVLIYVPSSGPGLTSPLLLSTGNGTDQSCMASGAYPSATATQTGVAQVMQTETLQPSSSVVLPSTTSNPEVVAQNTSTTSNLGRILGATLGAVAVVSALGLGLCFYWRRRRQRRVRPQSPGLAKEMNLDSNDAHLDSHSDIDHSPYHVHSPEGTVLPFVLPRPPQQGETLHTTRKGAPHTRIHAIARSRETFDSESSYIHGTGTSHSQSGVPPVPALPVLARGVEDSDPVFIQHEDGGSVPLPRAREVIELPPGYHQLPPQPQRSQPQGGRDEVQARRKIGISR